MPVLFSFTLKVLWITYRQVDVIRNKVLRRELNFNLPESHLLRNAVNTFSMQSNNNNNWNNNYYYTTTNNNNARDSSNSNSKSCRLKLFEKFFFIIFYHHNFIFLRCGIRTIYFFIRHTLNPSFHLMSHLNWIRMCIALSWNYYLCC